MIIGAILHMISMLIFIAFFWRRGKRFMVEGVITVWDAFSLPVLLICLAIPVINFVTALFLLLTMSFKVSYKHFGSWYDYYIAMNKNVLYRRGR